MMCLARAVWEASGAPGRSPRRMRVPGGQIRGEGLENGEDQTCGAGVRGSTLAGAVEHRSVQALESRKFLYFVAEHRRAQSCLLSAGVSEA